MTSLLVLRRCTACAWPRPATCSIRGCGKGAPHECRALRKYCRERSCRVRAGDFRSRCACRVRLRLLHDAGDRSRICLPSVEVEFHVASSGDRVHGLADCVRSRRSDWKSIRVIGADACRLAAERTKQRKRRENRTLPRKITLARARLDGSPGKPRGRLDEVRPSQPLISTSSTVGGAGRRDQAHTGHGQRPPCAWTMAARKYTYSFGTKSPASRVLTVAWCRGSNAGSPGSSRSPVAACAAGALAHGPSLILQVVRN